MKASTISQKGINLIRRFERFRSKPYLCPAGIPTIGIGTTRYPDGRRVSLKDPEITIEQATEFLRYEMKSIEEEVDSFTRDDISQNQFDALLSFAYNCGYNALRKSTLLKKINANPNDANIRKEFMRWIYSNGRRLKGLARRRNAEADLYFERMDSLADFKRKKLSADCFVLLRFASFLATAPATAPATASTLIFTNSDYMADCLTNN